MPAGRPSKYRREYCEQVKQWMSEGFSKEACAGKLGTTKQTLYTWMDKHPEFLDAIKAGEALSRGWWEQKGLEAMQGQIPGFNATVWVMSMKNMHGYRDKTETLHEVGQSLAEALRQANSDS